jgi:SAM-dependent methyltransferase
MKNTSTCPICGSTHWIQSGVRKYSTNDGYWSKGYPLIQKTVFFDLWHNSSESITLERNVCKMCGFVSDYPRPNESLLKRKYEYLAIAEKDLGSTNSMSNKIRRDEYTQALKAFNSISKLIKTPKRKLEVLDYGGGKGHYLLPMNDAGHNCFILDYNKYPWDGIVRLGNTYEDLKISQKFDVIICRHVLEHVASPLTIVSRLKEHLKKDGIVYAEVPMELLSAKTPNPDPVTHINYFNVKSFCRLFEEAGLNIVMSRQEISKYHGERGLQVKIIASMNSSSVVDASNGGYDETLFYFNHKILARIKNPIYYAYRHFQFIIKRVREPKAVN